MKKLCAIFFISIIFMVLFCVSCFSATDNHIDRELTVKKGMTTNEMDTPNLIIEESTDHISNFVFELVLENAEWIYDNSGTITQGVTYKKQGKKRLAVYVNVGVEDGQFDAVHEQLRIPLCVKFTDAGDATVTIESNQSAVSDGTYTFAYAIDGGFTLEAEKLAKIQRNGTLSTIRITDSSTQEYKKGTRLELTLSDNFTFANIPDIEGTRKFVNAVEFQLEGEDSSKAYIKITKTTDKDTGAIYLSNMQIKRKSGIDYNEAYMTIEYKTEKRSAPICKFGLTDEIEEITEQTTNTPPEISEPSEIEESSNEIVIESAFKVGEYSYTLNGEQRPLNAPAYIDESSSIMLPLRAVLNCVGITDENINWDSKEKKVSFISPKGTLMEIKAGTDYITADNDMVLKMNTFAVIKDNYFYLPLKSVALAIGILEANIVWYDINKTAVIRY